MLLTAPTAIPSATSFAAPTLRSLRSPVHEGLHPNHNSKGTRDAIFGRNGVSRQKVSVKFTVREQRKDIRSGCRNELSKVLISPKGLCTAGKYVGDRSIYGLFPREFIQFSAFTLF